MHSLLELFSEYCQRKKWTLQSATDKAIENQYPDADHITHIVSDKTQKIAVKLLDWKRPVGVDQIIRLHRFATEHNMKALLVANLISLNTKTYANKHYVLYLLREDLIKMLGHE